MEPALSDSSREERDEEAAAVERQQPVLANEINTKISCRGAMVEHPGHMAVAYLRPCGDWSFEEQQPLHSGLSGSGSSGRGSIAQGCPVCKDSRRCNAAAHFAPRRPLWERRGPHIRKLSSVRLRADGAATYFITSIATFAGIRG